MKYPKALQKGDTIGICAPSSGVSGETLFIRLDNAIRNIKTLGYDVIETDSVRRDDKCVSASSETRASEFMRLYKNPKVAAFDVISNRLTEQKSWGKWGGYSSWDDFTGEVYKLDKPFS